MGLAEFSRLSGRGLKQVYEAAQRDDLPVHVTRMGRRYFLPRAAVVRWLDTGQMQKPERG